MRTPVYVSSALHKLATTALAPLTRKASTRFVPPPPLSFQRLCCKEIPSFIASATEFCTIQLDLLSKKTDRAVLSRAVAGIRGTTILVNLAGSPTGAIESPDAIAALLPHAVAVLHGAKH